MEQREIFGSGESKCGARWWQRSSEGLVVTIEKARFDEVETIDVEGTGDELARVAAELLRT